MPTNTKPERLASSESIYRACTKKALKVIAKSVGIVPASKISKNQLIKEIEAEKPVITLKSEDLLSPLRPFLGAINREIERETISGREQDLIKDKFLERFGSSLSRLPYLTSKSMPDKKDWRSVQTISMNLESLHVILGTSPICKAGTILKYDPNAHEGPARIKMGQECLAVSSGIKRGDSILIKAIVVVAKDQ